MSDAFNRMPAPKFGIGDLVMYRHAPMNGDENAMIGTMRVEVMRTDGIDWAYAVMWWTADGGAHRFEFAERDLVRFGSADGRQPLFEDQGV